jgi:hypothetical protein
MNKEVLHLQVNNVICEGYDCFNKATTTINVKVGQLGTILLDLCTDCVKKFDDENTPGKSNLNQKLISGEDRRVTSIQGRTLKYE